MVNKTTLTQGKFGYTPSYKKTLSELYSTKVAIWQLPIYNASYRKYDTDDSKWFESENKNGQNEIDDIEQNLKINLSKYKIHSKTTTYEDYTYDIESIFPNRTKVYEKHGFNHVFVTIKDKFNRIVAEKIFGKHSNDGRKIIYTNINQGENIFTIAKVYSYDTTKNRATDVVNYAYTSLTSALTKGCKFEKEYYMLNGHQIKAEKIDDNTFRVKDKNGKILTFQVE